MEKFFTLGDQVTKIRVTNKKIKFNYINFCF